MFVVVLHIIQKDLGQAFIYFGLGLAFDPFTPTQAWNNKPLWQKTVLLSELILVLVSGVLLFFTHHF
ncbi:hypothetical protein [Flavobacterium sp.]|uniref:hypothetical protein n=1 Tax=Flavobacterium sp. TaxID=239 RepID=UPI002583B657|nr:hypothetical protein [Flavobacterium sp.]